MYSGIVHGRGTRLVTSRYQQCTTSWCQSKPKLRLLSKKHLPLTSHPYARRIQIISPPNAPSYSLSPWSTFISGRRLLFIFLEWRTSMIKPVLDRNRLFEELLYPQVVDDHFSVILIALVRRRVLKLKPCQVHGTLCLINTAGHPRN